MKRCQGEANDNFPHWWQANLGHLLLCLAVKEGVRGRAQATGPADLLKLTLTVTTVDPRRGKGEQGAQPALLARRGCARQEQDRRCLLDLHSPCEHLAELARFVAHAVRLVDDDIRPTLVCQVVCVGHQHCGRHEHNIDAPTSLLGTRPPHGRGGIGIGTVLARPLGRAATASERKTFVCTRLGDFVPLQHGPVRLIKGSQLFWRALVHQDVQPRAAVAKLVLPSIESTRWDDHEARRCVQHSLGGELRSHACHRGYGHPRLAQAHLVPKHTAQAELPRCQSRLESLSLVCKQRTFHAVAHRLRGWSTNVVRRWSCSVQHPLGEGGALGWHRDGQGPHHGSHTGLEAVTAITRAHVYMDTWEPHAPFLQPQTVECPGAVHNLGWPCRDAPTAGHQTCDAVHQMAAAILERGRVEHFFELRNKRLHRPLFGISIPCPVGNAFREAVEYTRHVTGQGSNQRLGSRSTSTTAHVAVVAVVVVVVVGKPYASLRSTTVATGCRSCLCVWRSKQRCRRRC